MKNQKMLRTENEPQFPWPNVAAAAYENYYGQVYLTQHKMCFWWRYNFVYTNQGQVVPRVWGAVFFENNPENNIFITQPVKEDTVTVNNQGTFFNNIGSFQYGKTTGNINDVLQWDLSFQENKTCFYSVANKLLAEVMSRSKNVSPNNNLFVSGSLKVKDQEYSFQNEPGHQGHTWGRVMPPGWTWCHCNAFHEKGTVFEMVGLDKKDKPPIGSFYLRWSDQEYYFNELRHFIGRQYVLLPYYRNHIQWDLKTLTFSGQERELRIDGTVIANPAQYHLVRYTNTNGTYLYNLNDSVARITVKLSIQKSGSWEQIAELYSEGAQLEFVCPTQPKGDIVSEAQAMGREWGP